MLLLLLQYKYVQLPTSADNVRMALPAFAEAWLLLSAGRRAHNSKPAADGTDGRTLDSFTDPAPHTILWAVPIMNTK